MMRSILIDRLGSRIVLATIVAAATHGGMSRAAEPSADTSAEAAIRESIEAYVAAFNKGDAEALAATWSPTGEWISEDGTRLKGRDAILAAARAKFAAGPKATLRVIDPIVRFPTADVAVEDGTAIVTEGDGSTTETTYTAVHVLRDGKWLLENVRETAVASSPVADRPLEALAWMVGDWVDASETATVKMKVEWTMNHRFLVSHFEVSAAGMIPLVGAQIIGFDRARGEIRSWLFDADGTIGEGVWTHDGRQWVVKSRQTLLDGTPASSTNVYLPRDSNSYAWKSIGRKIGDQYLPNIDEVIVVRKGATADPPAAKENSEVKP